MLSSGAYRGGKGPVLKPVARAAEEVFRNATMSPVSRAGAAMAATAARAAAANRAAAAAAPAARQSRLSGQAGLSPKLVGYLASRAAELAAARRDARALASQYAGAVRSELVERAARAAAVAAARGARVTGEVTRAGGLATPAAAAAVAGHRLPSPAPAAAAGSGVIGVPLHVTADGSSAEPRRACDRCQSVSAVRRLPTSLVGHAGHSPATHASLAGAHLGLSPSVALRRGRAAASLIASSRGASSLARRASFAAADAAAAASAPEAGPGRRAEVAPPPPAGPPPPQYAMRPHSAVRLSQSAAYLGHVLAGGSLHVPCSVTTLTDPSALVLLLGDDPDPDDDDPYQYARHGSYADDAGGTGGGTARVWYDDGASDGDVDYLVDEHGGGGSSSGSAAATERSGGDDEYVPLGSEDEAHAAQLVAIMRSMTALPHLPARSGTSELRH